MKLNREQYNTRGSAAVRESKFVVGDGAHIISLLRNNLYSDPIKAICREIVSNCRDAHRECGNDDVPVMVTFPNDFEDNIKFKDWGPGISPSRMDGVYTQFGNSTKRSSDSETGGFGLGAKTPFAYTSQFGVLTISKIETQDDIDILGEVGISTTLAETAGKNLRCEYIASLGGTDQNGGVKLMTAQITDEATGTEISIGVLAEDRKKFSTSLIESTRYWKVRPILKGFTVSYTKIPASVVSGTNWEITENEADQNQRYSYGYNEKKQKAIVDGIEYPLDIGRFKDSASKDVAEFSKLLVKTDLVIYFGTGDIELTPAREALQYDKRTVSVIEEKIKTISKEIDIDLGKRVEKASTFTEACEILHKFRTTIIQPRGEFFWKGNRCTSENYIHLLPKVVVNKTAVQNGINVSEAVARLDTYSMQYSTGTGDYKLVRSTKDNYKVGIDLLINDSGKTVSRDAVEAFRAHKGMTSSGCFQVLVATDGDIDGLKKRIKDHLQIDISVLPVENISTYEAKAAAKPRSKAQRGTSVVQIYEKGKGEWYKDRIERDTDSGVYVVLENRKTLVKSAKGGAAIPNWSFHRLIKALGITDNIYGIKEDVADNLGTGFVSLAQIIEDKKKALSVSKAEMTSLKIATYTYSNYKKSAVVTCLEKVGINSSELASLDAAIIDAYEKSKRLDVITLFYESISQPLPESDESAVRAAGTNALNDMQDSFIKKYPLLHHVDAYKLDRPGAKESIKEYVQLINENQKKLDSLSKAS